MRRFAPALLISLLLHVGLFMLAFLTWKNSPKPAPASSVPVEIVSQIPSHQMAEAPVDKLAVKTPSPVPEPEVPVKVEPKQAPPVPEPVKSVKKPEPAKETTAPPDKNGLKKPAPQKTTAKPQRDVLADILNNTPSKASTKKQAIASTRRTTGASNFGGAAVDAGPQLSQLGQKLARMWNPSCDVPGSREVVLELTVKLSPNGRVISGPVWTNRSNDPVWEAAFNRASAAIAKGQQFQLYLDLPQDAYNTDLPFTFDAKKACAGQ